MDAMEARTGSSPRRGGGITSVDAVAHAGRMAHLLCVTLLALSEQDSFEVDSRICGELAEFAGSIEDELRGAL